MLLARIRAWFQNDHHDRDLNLEIESHLALAAEEHIRAGMSKEAALRKARLELGGVAQLREAHRETRGLPFLDTLAQDLRYTFRTLRRDLGFTVFAVLIASLGIGASATIFSVVNALLIRPLPFPDADRLVWIGNVAADGVNEWSIQAGHLAGLREQNTSFTDLAGYFAFSSSGDTKLTGEGEPVRLSAIPVTETFFPILGVQPVIGRNFSHQESDNLNADAVLISYNLWESRYNFDPAILGRHITLNNQPKTVIGVMPETFDFGSIFAPASHVDLYLPFPLNEQTNPWGNTLGVVGKLKPGVSISAARAELTSLAKQLEAEHPRMNWLRPTIRSLAERVNGRFRPALVVLACAVSVVMLIVCANLANLQMARAATRQKEMAIRAALGAGRNRLVRQILTESLVLAAAGAVPGLLLAILGTRLFSHLETFSIPMLNSIRIDATSLAFTIAISAASGLVFGLLAALQAPLVNLQETLKDSTRSASGGRRQTGIRAILVTSEIALACMLLVGTGLLIRSFLRILDTDLGFQPERLAALRLDAPRSFENKTTVFYDEVLQKVKAINGIAAVSLTDTLPLSSDESSFGVSAKGRPQLPGGEPETFVRRVSEGYLATAGIRLIAGRDFNDRDHNPNEKVVIINESMARLLFPGESPLNQSLTVDDGRRIVGVAADVRHRAIEEASGCEMYLPLRQTQRYSVLLVVRTSLPPASLAASIREALRPIDADIAANEFRTIQQLVDKAVSPRRFVVWLLAGFSGFALVLAALGIYALIAYSVEQRTQEFGIRMALGAGAAELQARVLGETVKLAAVGIVIGMAASWALSRSLSGLLFGVPAGDPVTFAAMISVLALAAAAAGYLPARRASRIDPMIALRRV